MTALLLTEDVETNLLTSDSVIVRADLTCHGS
ncbi:MAG: hypothetical protein QOF90_2603 [Acetobacteraceae bacterium]|jgi:hypothetical protein|nr:hypothetical protein [Acetobacteraceae bacterium]